MEERFAIPLFCVEVLLGLATSSFFSSWVGSRQSVDLPHGLPEREAGQVAADGTRCPLSAAQKLHHNCLAAPSSAPASPSVTFPLTLSGTALCLEATVSASGHSAQHSSSW